MAVKNGEPSFTTTTTKGSPNRMPDVAVITGEQPLARWIDRLGAALVAPTLAMAASDTPEGQGRASSDVAILLLLAVFAVETQILAMSGWMLIDHDWGGAITVFLMGARTHLTMPILLLLGGSVVLTIVAGRKRRISDDFDLVSVALIPLVLIELLHSLVTYFFHLGAVAQQVGVYVGYTWAAGLLIVAYLQTRTRTPKSKTVQTSNTDTSGAQ